MTSKSPKPSKDGNCKAESMEAAQAKVEEEYYNSEHISILKILMVWIFRQKLNVKLCRNKEQLDVCLSLGMYPQAAQIGGELEDLQAVGGDIEAVYPTMNRWHLIVNDEGKLNGSELNRALRDNDGQIYDIVAGDFLVVGLGEENFASLSPQLMEKFEKEFHQPEMFVRMGAVLWHFPCRMTR